MNGQSFARNQARPEFGQFSFCFILKMTVKMFRNYELQNGVSQKLEPLIIEMKLLGLMS